MKKWIKVVSMIGMLGLLLTGLVACGSKQSSNGGASSGYRNSISKGLDAVAENNMNKALTYFENALTQKPNDKKAKAYRAQVQAYIDTQSELKSGEVNKAVATVNDGIKVTNGAKSLDTKLGNLKKIVLTDVAEYKQLDKDVTAQLKVTDGNYSSDVLKTCKNINWKKKPYLNKLKLKVKKLLKQATQSGGMSNSTTESSDSSTTNKVSASDQKMAEQMRQNIVQADPDSWDSNALAQVPDSVIVAATKKANETNGDPGTVAGMIAKQYPNIKKNTSSSDSSGSSANTKARADQIRTVLANNQDFSKAVLDDIPDSEVLAAAKGGFMTNADIARTAGTLLQSHPDLK